VAEPATTTYRGIIKCVIGPSYGFIVPLALELEQDLYFHRSSLAGELGELGEDLENAAGKMVEFELSAYRFSDKTPPVRSWRPCTPDEIAQTVADLAVRLGPCPEDVGIVGEVQGQTMIATDHRGFFRDVVVRACPRGALVRFEATPGPRCVARAVGVIESGEVSPARKQLLQRLVRRHQTPATNGPDFTRVTPSALMQVRSTEQVSLRWVQHAHMLVRTGQRAEEALDAIASLEAQDHPDAPWWRAMLVYASLWRAVQQEEPIGAVLDRLLAGQEAWSRGNFDCFAIWVTRVLRDFNLDFPEELDLDQVCAFLERLQHARGNSPHFRLEILQARLRLEQHDATGEKALLAEALKNAERALVLNPRQSEALDLHDLLRRRAVAAGLWSVSTPLGSAESGSDEADAVRAVQRIKRFYQDEAGGAEGLDRARAFYEERLGKMAGVVLDQLILEHARILLRWGNAADAEQVVLQYLLSQAPAQGWSAPLQLLQETWTGQRYTLDRVIQKVDEIRPRVPAEAQHLLGLIKARFAYEAGNYALALQFAEESERGSPTQEARQLRRRAQFILGGSQASDLSVEEKHDQALQMLRRSAVAEEGRGPIELVLEALDDDTVGPWLVREVLAGHVQELGDLGQADRLNLLDRAIARLRRPDRDVLLADVQERWGENRQYRREAGLLENIDEDLIEAVLRQPTRDTLQIAQQSLAQAPCCALALFDCLGRQLPANLEVRWSRALAARKMGRKLDYLAAALPCAGHPDLPKVTWAVVADDLLGLELFGLALGMAYLARTPPLLQLAEERGRMEPWEWPARLQQAKASHAAGNWGEAADSAIRVLASAPDHWPACRAFSQLFSQAIEEESGGGSRILEVGRAVVSHLQQKHRHALPELLVLEAELILHREGQGGNRVIDQTVVDQCIDLCARAQQARAGFQPAIYLEAHLHAQQDSVLAPGRLYNRIFRIERALTSGSFGRVYKARLEEERANWPAVLALKMVRSEGATVEKTRQRRDSFRREARILKNLIHPHIVRTYDFIDDRCLVMEYIEGTTLESKIQQQVTLDWQTVARIGLQVARALDYAGAVTRQTPGSRGDFAHRDIHPGNIMIEERPDGPHAKLLDFGLARVEGSTLTSAVFDGINKRLHYRDPNYGARTDFRGDMFSLGVILYELLSGQGPYPRDRYCEYLADSRLAREIEDLRRSVRNLLPPGSGEVPLELENILLRMVAFRAASRYQRWEDLIDAFTRLLPRGSSGSG
jgi:hypothetical protein